MLSSSPEVLQTCIHIWVGTWVSLEKPQVPQATGTLQSRGLGPGGAYHHPTRTNTPPSRPLELSRQENLVFTRHPACLPERWEPPIFFLNDNFPPLFVAKNHPGLSRREGRKLCREREGKIISLGHRHSRLSSVCRRRGEGGRAAGMRGPGMKMKAGPNPSLSSSALGAGGGGRADPGGEG